MEKPKSSTPKPQAWLYLLVRWFCCLLSKVLFRLKVTGQKSLPKEGPLLVMASHQGMMDFMLAFAALKGRKAQFVATMRQFRNPLAVRTAGRDPQGAVPHRSPVRHEHSAGA